MLTLAQLNAASREGFVEALGWVFENSPWVAERSYDRRPFISVEALHAVMVRQVQLADPGERLALLCAHPDLGSRARMSDASAGEQTGAGLDRLTPEEYQRLLELNARYRETFGFNFIYAVKGSTKHDILRELEQRLHSTREAEFHEALQQVFRIASFRLTDAISKEG
jgi:2-oxo-4-hydroxy-4-carboxy-5-ureidoimidazoline decarboxylase